MEVAEFGNTYVAVNVDGKKIEASFATSQAISVMSTTVARRVFGIAATVADVEPDNDDQVLSACLRWASDNGIRQSRHLAPPGASCRSR